MFDLAYTLESYDLVPATEGIKDVAKGIVEFAKRIFKKISERFSNLKQRLAEKLQRAKSVADAVETTIPATKFCKTAKAALADIARFNAELRSNYFANKPDSINKWGVKFETIHLPKLTDLREELRLIVREKGRLTFAPSLFSEFMGLADQFKKMADEALKNFHYIERTVAIAEDIENKRELDSAVMYALTEISTISSIVAGVVSMSDLQ